MAEKSTIVTRPWVTGQSQWGSGSILYRKRWKSVADLQSLRDAQIHFRILGLGLGLGHGNYRASRCQCSREIMHPHFQITITLSIINPLT